ncbi:MAG: alkaline phosphatase family protein [Chloroflexi bacterium]|nr:alkaline phosphatase family protein [Chloroflexota bacterium]
MTGNSSKVLVLGLDCATPQLVFDRFAGELENLGQLRREGVWGELTSVIPAITVPAWACSMTSRDPGQLGIYGFRNRKDYSYEGLAFANAAAVREPAVWDILSGLGKHVIVISVPPSYPPAPVNGCRVGCFLTPNTDSDYTYPAELKSEIASVVGEYMIDVPEFRSEDKERILKQAQEMAARRFRLLRHLLKTRPWDFAMMVEIGLDRVHHGFWQHFDETHPKYEPGSPYRDAVLDYYRLLDREIGALLAELDGDTTVIVMSDHGAKAMLGGVCINEWLIQEGYLRLKSPPDGPTRFAFEAVDWARTKAWGEGGYYGRVFINVQGREPQGTVPPDEYEAFRDKLSTRLAAIPDHEGRPLVTRVFKPEQIYKECRNVPPDLIVYFGDLDWRAVAQVGTGSVYTFENDTGPDGANHAQHGIFVMRGPGIQGGRRLDGLQIVDCGPTVMERLGLPVPTEMIGRPIR